MLLWIDYKQYSSESWNLLEETCPIRYWFLKKCIDDISIHKCAMTVKLSCYNWSKSWPTSTSRQRQRESISKVKVTNRCKYVCVMSVFTVFPKPWTNGNAAVVICHDTFRTSGGAFCSRLILFTSPSGGRSPWSSVVAPGHTCRWHWRGISCRHQSVPWRAPLEDGTGRGTPSSPWGRSGPDRTYRTLRTGHHTLRPAT